MTWIKGEEKAKKTKYIDFLDKYNFDDNWNVIIPFDLWKGILLNSNIQKEEIDYALKNKVNTIFDENTPSWEKIIKFL